MQNYLVKVSDAPFSTSDLNTRTIVFAGHTYNDCVMYLFDEVMYNRVLDELNLVSVSVENTNIEGLKQVTLQRKSGSVAPSEPESTLYSNVNHGLDLSSLEEKIGRKILIHRIPRSYVIEPVNDLDYHVWLFATPVKTNKANEAKRSIFGKRWSREDYPLVPSDKSQIITDFEDKPVAEYLDNNLYVYYNLKYLDDGDNDAEVLKLIIVKAIYGDEDFAKFIREENFRTKKKEFTDFCAKMEYRRKESIKSRVEELRNEIADFSEKFVNASRELRIVERDLVNYENLVNGALPEYEREFARVRNISKVLSFELGDQQIVVTTVPLTCVDPRNDKVHAMGSYRITIRLNNRFGIRFENLTRQVGGKPHPHSDGDGAPCLGNFNEVLPQLVMQNQFATIIIMAIKFLESVNTDDAWGDRIKDWPVDPAYAARLIAEKLPVPPAPESEYDEDNDVEEEDDDGYNDEDRDND